MYQYWFLHVATLVQDVDKRGSAGGGRGSVQQLLVHSGQFFHKVKTVVKIKSIKIKF